MDLIEVNVPKPLEALFPDKRCDSQLKNPGTGEIFDFDDVIVTENPIAEIIKTTAYYPQAEQTDLCSIFISGLGQTEAESSNRQANR
jgi:hypothetical protein